MTLFLTYELKVAVLIAVFYVFWRLLVANETWHRLNRIVLLATAVASFVLPLCVITIHQTIEVTTETMTTALPMEEIPISAESPSVTVASETEQPFNWQLPLTILYIIGVLVVLSRVAISLLRLHRMKAESEIHPLADGRQIAVCDKAKTPFSWWKTVFLNHQDFEEGTSALLTHELGHLQMHHSVDVLLVELLTALQWFNPTMWMLRADLRTIHEYEADQQVLSHGFNDIQYLQLLIRKAAGQSGYSLANGISNSALKKRVTMIMKPKSNRNSMLKLLALVPIVGITLALNANTVTDYVNDEPQKQQPIKKGNKNGTIKMGSQPKAELVVVEVAPVTSKSADDKSEKIFDVVKQMPEFRGGDKAMFEFLSKHIQYPEEARKKSIQGRVITTFVVEKDGSISNARVVKPVNPDLDAEALRVVNAMPNWNPGKQNGKAVRVKYTVPVTFKLDAAQPAEKYILEIDGKVVDDAEIANIPAGDVVSIDAVPAQNGQPKKIVITTKKKK